MIDLQPGSACHADMVFGGGAHVARLRAVCDVVDRPNRLGWTEVESGMRTVVELVELDDGVTTVTTTLIDPPVDFVTPKGRRGFQTSLDRMVAYTAGVKGSGCVGVAHGVCGLSRPAPGTVCAVPTPS